MIKSFAAEITTWYLWTKKKEQFLENFSKVAPAFTKTAFSLRAQQYSPSNPK